ncbi:MAG: LytTR family DNA-binding domain-containing protein [Lachnospiraceae bacterium]|nr:LytTR family DNA-binding domain-containing protein [Lachnospiraceae bacterium]
MKQYRIVIVEDDSEYASFLASCLSKYGEENDCNFFARVYNKAESFLDVYNNSADIVFMDIELGDGFMNGMEAAKKFRKIDPLAILIFVTNMPQYAPQGYDVNALDYLLKPIDYGSLKVKLDKALKVIQERAGVPIKVKEKQGTRIISSNELMYIEVMGHDLTYHMVDGEITAYGGLREKEAELSGANFARCSASILVNLAFIKGLYGDDIEVGNERLRIGRSKKKAFLEQLNRYLGN